MRLFSVSDLHVDYRENQDWVLGLSTQDFTGDALILAGDVSHRTERLEQALGELRRRFGALFFVPGNHDLWVRPQGELDSLGRFRQLLALCEALDVTTEPRRLGPPGEGVWVVPLLSWYARPEESRESLFVPKESEDPSLSMWVDDRAVRWPDFGGGITACDYFAGLNEPYLGLPWDAPVVSFSHFLPRRELMWPTPEELSRWTGPLVDPFPQFNFSRVAGTEALDRQLRALGSTVHVYGHQHRNRQVRIDGVSYVSHCLGYPRERESGRLLDALGPPRLIWQSP